MAIRPGSPPSSFAPFHDHRRGLPVPVLSRNVRAMWDMLPLWAIGLLLSLAMILACEAGDWTFRRTPRGARGEGTSDEGYILSAVLGLLALLLAFSLSMALTRHENRRTLVVAEADAISTLSHRLRLLDPPAREQTLAMLKSYGEARVEASQMDIGPGRISAEARAQALDDRLTTAILAAVQPARTSPSTPLIVQATDAVSDIATDRLAATRARLPARVLDLLALYCIAAAGMLGYTVAAAGGRHRPAAYTMFVLLAFAFATIHDLDRPRSGAILVDQSILVDTVSRL